VARRSLTGVLLVGGASRRFGSPKALARLGGETLAERAWRILGEACDERLAVGKLADGLELPFAVVDDRGAARHPAVGIVTGLRSASNEVCVFLPVDCPSMTPEALRLLGEACTDAAVPTMRDPLPGAYAKRALGTLERALARDGSIRAALEELDVRCVDLDPRLLANVNTPAELEALRRAPPAPPTA
jgi:molybdopterin-guanine dinucleotide biosynthesis protein A